MCPYCVLYYREMIGQSFQEEFSDMLLLEMLKSATEASKDKDKVNTSFIRNECVFHPNKLDSSHLLLDSMLQTRRHVGMRAQQL